MPGPDEKFLKRLLVTFQTEAREHVQAIDSGLVQLENASAEEARTQLLDRIFRAAHSLKGAARTVNVTDIEALCQSLENVFAALKNRKSRPTPKVFDFLHSAVSALWQLLQAIETGVAPGPALSVSKIVQVLEGTLTENAPSSHREAPAEAAVRPSSAVLESPQGGALETSRVSDTIRVSATKLDAVLLGIEEMLSVKLSVKERATNLRRLQTWPSEWKKKWVKLREEVRTVEKRIKQLNGDAGNSPDLSVLRIIEFLEWHRDSIESFERELADTAKSSLQEQRMVSAMVDNLLDEIKKVVMQPFSTVLDSFPRFVRELSRDQKKEVELVVRGGEIEMDKRVLEELKDPLIHLVRNSLDHGIEQPQERVKQGKLARGKILISLAPKDGNTVELLVTDDGAGIDALKVKAAAVKSGILDPAKAESLGTEEILRFIFHTGISTSPIVTDISGRGLGLAIVKEKVERLRGTLSLETDFGKGTTFRVIVPLTIARFRGVFVRVQEFQYVIPTCDIERVARITETDIKTVENRPTISLRGQAISLVQFSDVLGLAPKTLVSPSPKSRPLVVLHAGDQRIAFLVDEVLVEQEVLVKTLGKQLTQVRNIAGATILGADQVVPIINVAELIKSAVRMGDVEVKLPSAASAVTEAPKKSVLVAEDSITSRSLLRNILEAAGYHVETAVDGTDAFTKLRGAQFDLVVSDVDMPGLNGFGLTAKIRADKKLGELPVVLVTALDSRADREHGIDVGANAYIVKSSFDQSNLLEVIRRFI